MRKSFLFFIVSSLFLAGCSSGFYQVRQDPYEIISYGTSEDTSLFIKYSTYTGQAWILSEGWLLIPDDEVLPESKYVIKVVSMAEQRYTAVRIDTITGRSWSSISNRWVEIKTK
jgi:hypothetical protein